MASKLASSFFLENLNAEIRKYASTFNKFSWNLIFSQSVFQDTWRKHGTQKYSILRYNFARITLVSIDKRTRKASKRWKKKVSWVKRVIKATTDYRHPEVTSQILYGQYLIWELYVLGLKTKVFLQRKQSNTQNDGQGVNVGALVWPKIPKVTQTFRPNLSAEAQKFEIFEKKLSLGVRIPWWQHRNRAPLLKGRNYHKTAPSILPLIW